MVLGIKLPIVAFKFAVFELEKLAKSVSDVETCKVNVSPAGFD